MTQDEDDVGGVWNGAGVCLVMGLSSLLFCTLALTNDALYTRVFVGCRFALRPGVYNMNVFQRCGESSYFALLRLIFGSLLFWRVPGMTS